MRTSHNPTFLVGLPPLRWVVVVVVVVVELEGRRGGEPQRLWLLQGGLATALQPPHRVADGRSACDVPGPGQRLIARERDG